MPRPAAPIRERILRSIVIDDNGCWRWQLRKDRQGYGRITISADGTARPRAAHRIAYIEFRGEIPAGLEPDHTCRVRDCVNPWHLEPVTRSENLRRSPLIGSNSGNAAKTHCPRGHEYSAENTLYRPGKGRECRTCNRDHGQRWRERNAANAA